MDKLKEITADSKPGKTHRLTRLVYCSLNGPIEGNLIVRHKCDNPSCVNPTHLELGTNDDNSKDMMSRGRHRASNGASHYMVSLTEEEVYEIREFEYSGCTQEEEVAETFNVNRKVISDIWLRRTWKRLPEKAKS